jgi:hypothetical protein
VSGFFFILHVTKSMWHFYNNKQCSIYRHASIFLSIRIYFL